MARKLTTGLVGLAVELQPREKLRILYGHTLEALSAMPKTYLYRKHAEDLTNQRLSLVNEIKDLDLLESKINGGQLEEVIMQAKAELTLSRKIKSWQPWEPLSAEPPSGQWAWP